MTKRLALVFSILVITYNQSVLAYDAGVHEEITKNAVRVSQIDNFLRETLNLENGIDTTVNQAIVEGKTIASALDWFVYGSRAEDNPILRSVNHFHDPLRSWAEAGLHQSVLDPFTSVSSILWGLEPGHQDRSSVFEGDWSWATARRMFYEALTATDKEERNARFADCFKSLGHVMHLVQDASVPMHSRNDIHVFPVNFRDWEIGTRWTYETYTRRNTGLLPYWSYYPHPDLLRDPRPDGGYGDLTAVSGLIDRNMYDGTGGIPPHGYLLGLAEYSNANFLTQDTMWTYPHPSLADTDFDRLDWANPELILAEDGDLDNRLYVSRTAGEPMPHLAAIGYWALDLFGFGGGLEFAFLLDELCWADYARELIPRAVGYSAVLIDYFFRGKIEITDQVVGLNLSSVQLEARNITENGDEMSDGTLYLVVRYRMGEDIRYVVTLEANNLRSIPRDSTVNLRFDLTTTPIPANATIDYFQVVYSGHLGQAVEGGWVGETEGVAVGLGRPYRFVLATQNALRMLDRHTGRQIIAGEFLNFGLSGEEWMGVEISTVGDCILRINEVAVDNNQWTYLSAMTETDIPRTWSIEAPHFGADFSIRVAIQDDFEYEVHLVSFDSLNYESRRSRWTFAEFDDDNGICCDELAYYLVIDDSDNRSYSLHAALAGSFGEGGFYRINALPAGLWVCDQEYDMVEWGWIPPAGTPGCPCQQNCYSFHCAVSNTGEIHGSVAWELTEGTYRGWSARFSSQQFNVVYIYSSYRVETVNACHWERAIIPVDWFRHGYQDEVPTLCEIPYGENYHVGNPRPREIDLRFRIENSPLERIFSGMGLPLIEQPVSIDFGEGIIEDVL